MSGVSSLTVEAGTVPAAQLRWVALGDSLTAGSAPGELTWARIAEGSASTARRRLELLCLAEAGATTRCVAERQLEPAIAAEPGLLTMICGANDVIGSVRPRIDEVVTRLGSIWSALRAGLPSTPMLTGTYPPLAPRSLGPRSRVRIERGLEELNEGVRGLAREHGLLCVELAGHPGESDPRNFAADGLHPSPAGHVEAAATLVPAIRSLIDEEERE